MTSVFQLSYLKFYPVHASCSLLLIFPSSLTAPGLLYLLFVGFLYVKSIRIETTVSVFKKHLFFSTVLAPCLCLHERAATRRWTLVSSSILSAFFFEAESLPEVWPHIFSAVLEAVSPRGTPVPIPSELVLQVCARLVSRYVGAGI